MCAAAETDSFFLIVLNKMQKFHKINIAGRAEDLPIIKIADSLAIAFFNLNGNQALTEHCANALAELARGTDIVLTAESKGIALAHCVARKLGQDKYIVARKSKKLYMTATIEADVRSITTAGKQTLYLLADDVALLKGKSITIVDDVISTGESLRALEELAFKAGATVVKKLAVLAEGDASKRDDIHFLAAIPIFRL